MDITKGFKIDEPDVFVPWEINEDEFVCLFHDDQIKRVVKGYHTGKFISLGGLNCMIGFHFEKGIKDRLEEIEFFRRNYPDQKQSFNEFQKYFVQQFGKPTNTVQGNEGFENHEWRTGSIRIIHLVHDRFGLEEHMRIKFNRNKQPLYSKLILSFRAIVKNLLRPV